MQRRRLKDDRSLRESMLNLDTNIEVKKKKKKGEYYREKENAAW